MKQDELSRRGRAWIELDRGALENNVNILRSLIPERCALMPALKANAYGHGAALFVPELLRLGVHDFCVATAAEGAEVRQCGADGTVLVLGWTHPDDFPLLRRYELTQNATDHDYASLLNQYGGIHVHLGIDTGMHRLGEPCENFEGIADILSMKNLHADGIFTHLCTADSGAPEAVSFALRQLNDFNTVVRRLRALGFADLKTHSLGSSAMFNYSEHAGDYARPGIALYGVMSTQQETRQRGGALRGVLSLRARISAVKTLRAGEGAGYGLDFIAQRDSKIAVLTIGYGDGVPRCLSNGVGRVLIGGHYAPIAGRICMDQALADVTDIPDAHAGGIATIIGRDGKNEISSCELAEHAGTITNEIFSRLSSRLERFWA